MQGMVAGVGVGGQSRLWFYKDVTVPPPSIRMLQQHLHIPKACKFRKYRRFNRSSIIQGSFRVEASGADFGTNIYEENEDKNPQKKSSIDESRSENVSEPVKQKGSLHFTRSIAGVLIIGTVAATVLTLISGGPSSLMASISKSGFTAAFALIFVSEIGDKTFFIAALLAMQYSRVLVLLGSMGALSLMTIISVVIGRIFHSIPTQFQTTLPIGEYAAVALLLFFGFKSIKDAWDLPTESKKSGADVPELGELVEAEELVKTEVSKRLNTPAEIIWKSFSLAFFAEWGDRSMLATIALGAAQSPWGVASGAIGGHVAATSIAVVGGGLLAQYISEKVVGYLGGALFIVFAIATLLGAF